MNSRTTAALHEVAVAAGRLRDEQGLATLVVERARLVAGGDAAVLRWFDDASSAFRLLATAGVSVEPASEIAAEAPTAIREAFQTGRAVIVNDYRGSGQTTGWGRRHRIQAQLAVPLLVDGRAVGTLTVLSFGKHRYDDADAIFLSLMSAIVAPALQAARLAGEVDRQRDITTQVYDALGAHVIVYDRAGRPIYYNSASLAAWGDALDDPSGARDHSYPTFHADGRPVAPGERPFARALTSKAAVRGIVAGFDILGCRHWALVDAVPVLDAGGEVDFVITSFVDITSLKEAEAREKSAAAALRASEQLFSGAFQASGVGMALTDRDGSVIRANSSLCALLGYSECELVGMSAQQLVLADDLPMVRHALAGLYVKADPAVADQDLRVVHRDGHTIWTRVTASLVRVDEEPRHVLLHIVDISEERRARSILESEQERLGVIIEAQREIASSEVDFDRLLAVLCERTIALTSSGSASVLLPDGDELVVRAMAGVPTVDIGFRLPIDGSLAGLAFRTGELQRVSDAKNDDRVHKRTAQAMGLGAMVSAPMITEDGVIGVLQLVSYSAGALDETDARTLLMIAGFAAAAYQRASSTRRLRSSEHRVRAVMDSAPDPIVVFNSGGEIVDFNPAAEKTFLRSRSEVVGGQAMVLLAPKHLAAFRRWNSAGNDARSHEYAGRVFEAVGRRGDGTEFPMEIVITDLPEETRLVAAFIRDMTLRDRLRESRERLASVVASAPVIFLACSEDGLIQLAEGSGLAALGLTADQVVGRPLRELARWDSSGAAVIARVLQGESVQARVHVVEPDLHLNVASSPIRSGDGAVTGFSVVITDVTARVRAWEAQRESEAKSRLMAMMNHEVRTPLNSILGFAHLLRDPHFGALNDRQLRYVANVEASGQHLLELVNESLDLARIDIGRVRIDLADVAVRAVVEQAADQVRPLAEAKGLRLRVAAAGALSVRADHRQLVQVLLNLLSNAIRHTRAGGSVTLSARREGGDVLVSVADTGDGISREDQARLFEEFFQASNHAPGGIGLGLAISRRLVQLMGGSIGVESRLGQGSTFTIRMPARSTASD